MAGKKAIIAKNTNNVSENALFAELSSLIEKSKQRAVSQVKSTLNLLYWQIGKRINDEILNNKRAEYGSQIVANLAEKLTGKYGRSFELRNLRRMIQFAGDFPDKKIVSTLSTHLNWSHIIELLPLQSAESKFFYANEVREQGFGVRELRKSIATKTFERTQIANIKISGKSKIPLGTF